MALEYYDFVIYALLAPYLKNLFFPVEQSGHWSLIETYLIFAVGYLARPLGGTFFGLMSDRLGRKKVILFVMNLMAYSTLCMGLLPTYQQLGYFSPLLLLILRVIQGLSFGAELPSAFTLLHEALGTNRSGRAGGVMISFTTIGSLLATLILTLLTTTLTHEKMELWGWRVPFLLGGTLAIMSALLRKKLPETLTLKKQESTLHKLSFLFRSHNLSLLSAMMMTASVSSLIIINLYFPIHFKEWQIFSAEKTYWIMTIGQLWCVFILPLIGYLSDKWNRGRSLVLFLVGAIFLLPYLWGIKDHHPYLFIILYQTVVCWNIAHYFPLLGTLFPQEIRNTAIGFCYNVVYSLMSFSPIFFTYVTSTYSIEKAPLWWGLITLSISILGIFTIPKKHFQQ